LGEFRGFKITK